MRLIAATAITLLLATPAWGAQEPTPHPPAPVVLDSSQLDQVTAGNSALSKYRPQFYFRALAVAGRGKLFVGNLTWSDTSAHDYLRVTLQDTLIRS